MPAICARAPKSPSWPATNQRRHCAFQLHDRRQLWICGPCERLLFHLSYAYTTCSLPRYRSSLDSGSSFIFRSFACSYKSRRSLFQLFFHVDLGLFFWEYLEMDHDSMTIPAVVFCLGFVFLCNCLFFGFGCVFSWFCTRVFCCKN